MPGASCLGLTHWKAENIISPVSRWLNVPQLYSDRSIQYWYILFPVINAMSLAWMSGSSHHKAGESLEVRGVPSGRTSVLLKPHNHRYFLIFKPLKPGGSFIISLKLFSESSNTFSKISNTVMKNENSLCFWNINYNKLKNTSKLFKSVCGLGRTSDSVGVGVELLQL